MGVVAINCVGKPVQVIAEPKVEAMLMEGVPVLTVSLIALLVTGAGAAQVELEVSTQVITSPSFHMVLV
jgi:hypothetical protein